MTKLLKALITVVILATIHGTVVGDDHNSTSSNDTSQERTPSAKNYDKQCLNSLSEVERELSSTIPPKGKTTNNYRNISRALFPALKMPSLYVKITLRFTDDTVNQTVVNVKKFTWMESCGFVTDVSLQIMTVFSLLTLYPQRRQSELHLTVHPLCIPAAFVEENGFEDEAEMWRYALLTLQDMVIRPNVSDPRVNTAQCVVKGHEGDKYQPIDMKSLKWLSFRGYWVLSASVFVSGVISWYASQWFSLQTRERMRTYLCMVPYCLFLLCLEVILTCIELFKLDSFQKKVQFHCIINVSFHYVFWVVMLFVNYKCPPVYTIENKFCDLCKYFVYPCVYQICHHLFWIFCEGIPADPSWAVPLFLSECFAMLALLIANSLCRNLKDCWHIGVSALAVLFGLFTIVISFYNSSIGELTGNVLALGMAGVLGYVIKKSGLYKGGGGADNNGTLGNGSAPNGTEHNNRAENNGNEQNNERRHSNADQGNSSRFHQEGEGQNDSALSVQASLLQNNNGGNP